jgi:hypothetical protein
MCYYETSSLAVLLIHVQTLPSIMTDFRISFFQQSFQSNTGIVSQNGKHCSISIPSQVIIDAKESYFLIERSKNSQRRVLLNAMYKAVYP